MVTYMPSPFFPFHTHTREKREKEEELKKHFFLQIFQYEYKHKEQTGDGTFIHLSRCTAGLFLAVSVKALFCGGITVK